MIGASGLTNPPTIPNPLPRCSRCGGRVFEEPQWGRLVDLVCVNCGWREYSEPAEPDPKEIVAAG